jgi:hypothetical protein
LRGGSGEVRADNDSIDTTPFIKGGTTWAKDILYLTFLDEAMSASYKIRYGDLWGDNSELESRVADVNITDLSGHSSELTLTGDDDVGTRNQFTSITSKVCPYRRT